MLYFENDYCKIVKHFFKKLFIFLERIILSHFL